MQIATRTGMQLPEQMLNTHVSLTREYNVSITYGQQVTAQLHVVNTWQARPTNYRNRVDKAGVAYMEDNYYYNWIV